MPAREGADCASQATVRFEDIMIYFSKSEWESLANWQKELYWEVLTDNYEALLVAGRPATRVEVLAWLKRCERLGIEGTQESRVGDPAENFPATSARPSKACREERKGQVESLETLRDKSKEVMPQHGDMGGTPEHLHFSARPQGIPTKDEPLSHTEHGQSLASPAFSQRPVVAPKQYKCEECGKRFRLEGLLRMHQQIMRKMSLACSTCGLCFTSPLCLRMHQRRHLSAGVDRGKDSPCQNRLSVQQGTHVPEKLHQCADCGDRFHSFLDVLRHQKSHEEARPRPCSQCKASFMHRIDLATHEEGHLEEALKRHDRRRRKCLCKHAFRLHFAALLGRGARDSQGASRDPERPQQDSGAGGETPHLCAGCGLLFKQEENLEVHYRYCSKQWLQKASSPIARPGGHQEACEKQGVARPVSKGGSGGDARIPSPPLQASSARHSCPECGKHFTSKGSLRRHKRKHNAALQRRRSAVYVSGSSHATARTTKKLYKCQECGKKLVYKWQVTAHQQGHAEGKSFICLRCGESFGFKIGFRKHRLTCAAGGPSGSGAPSEARLLCQCGKSLLKSHFSRHQEFHAGLRYRCRLCGKVLSFLSTAISHCRRHVRKGELPAGLSGSELSSNTIEKVYIPPGPQLQSPEEPGQPNYSFPTEQLLFWQGAPAEGGKSPWQEGKLKSPRVALPKPYKCRDCSKDFVHLAHLLRHRREHEGDFPFQCAECGKGFISRNYLNLHWKIHAKESA